MTKPQQRFSYVFKDINSLKPEELRPNEVLLDYVDNDIIVVDNNCQPISFKRFISDGLGTKLNTDHIIESNQHAVATKLLSGFMSPEDKVKLCELDDIIKEYSKMLSNSRMNAKFNLIDMKYSIIGDLLFMDTIINNAGSLITVSDTLDISKRPSREYHNISNEIGYRYDIVYISISPEAISMNIEFDVVYSDNYIQIGNNKFDYDKDKAVYKMHGMCDMIPVLLIKRRNDQIVSELNINGKFSDNSISLEEISDISRRLLPTVSYGRIVEYISKMIDIGLSYGEDVTKIVKSGIKYEIDSTNTLSYISFDMNDVESISGAELNKNCTFKPSPFGNMMSYAEKEGNALTLNHRSTDFSIDVILDIAEANSIPGQCIFALYGALMGEPILSIDYLGKENFKISYGKNIISESFNIKDFDKIKNRYISLMVHVTRYSVSVILNGRHVCEINTEVDIDTMSNFKINSKSFPIGNVVISNNTSNLRNKYINDNVILMEKFDVATKDDIVCGKEILFTTKDISELLMQGIDINITTDGVESSQVKEGSLIELNFSKELIYMVNAISKVTHIDGNKITLDISAKGFKIGDTILLSENKIGTGKRFMYEILYIEDNTLLLNNDVDIEFIGYYISDMSNTSYIKLLDSENNSVGSVGIRDNVVKVISKKSYTSNSTFRLNYIEKKHKSNIMDCIKDVESITLGNIMVEDSKDNLIKNVKISDMNIKLNGEALPKVPKNIAIFSKEDIELELEYILTKCIAVTDLSIIENMIEIIGVVNLANGYDELYINGDYYHNDNFMSPIHVPILFEDGKLSLNIKSNYVNDSEQNKLIIESISIDIRFKKEFKKIFTKKDIYSKVLEYLVMSDDVIYSNISPLNMNISEKVDSFEIIKDIVYLSEDINGYRLVKTHNNIIKILQTNSGKIYGLEKKYIV